MQFSGMMIALLIVFVWAVVKYLRARSQSVEFKWLGIAIISVVVWWAAVWMQIPQ